MKILLYIGHSMVFDDIHQIILAYLRRKKKCIMKILLYIGKNPVR